MNQPHDPINTSSLTKRPTGVPFGSSWSTSDRSHVELTSDTLDNILNGVITEMTRLEYLPFVESSRSTVNDLLSVIRPQCKIDSSPAPDGNTSTQ
jgi:hypothetical protein